MARRCGRPGAGRIVENSWTVITSPPPAFCRETASWRQRHRFCGCGSDAGWRVVGAPQRDAPRVTRIAALFNPAMATFAEFWLKPFKAAASTAAVRGQHWRISCDDASMLLTAQESRSHRFLFIEVTNTARSSVPRAAPTDCLFRRHRLGFFRLGKEANVWRAQTYF